MSDTLCKVINVLKLYFTGKENFSILYQLTLLQLSTRVLMMTSKASSNKRPTTKVPLLHIGCHPCPFHSTWFQPFCHSHLKISSVHSQSQMEGTRLAGLKWTQKCHLESHQLIHLEVVRAFKPSAHLLGEQITLFLCFNVRVDHLKAVVC